MFSGLEVHGVPVECINQAAISYHVPATLIISVLAVEGGHVGLASKNKNNTYDYGPMQINTVWLKKIKPYGYTQQQLQYDPCVNVMVGTWILSTKIANAASLWQGVANYHSYTAHLNQNYPYKVADVYYILFNYLSRPKVG